MPSPDPALVAMLTRHEGIRLRPYRDTVGKLTIGIGRNLDDVGISADEARLLCANDIERAQEGLDSALPWWRSLDAARQRALTDLAFNMGIAGLLTFQHTLACLAQGDYTEAARGLRESLWAKQVGAVRVADITGLIEKGDAA